MKRDNFREGNYCICEQIRVNRKSMQMDSWGNQKSYGGDPAYYPTHDREKRVYGARHADLHWETDGRISWIYWFIQARALPSADFFVHYLLGAVNPVQRCMQGVFGLHSEPYETVQPRSGPFSFGQIDIKWIESTGQECHAASAAQNWRKAAGFSLGIHTMERPTQPAAVQSIR